MSTILVRRAPDHAVVAHVSEDGLGVRLLRLTPDAGPVPEWTDLSGRAFPDRPSLRRAIVARMRALVRREPQATTLDRVLLSRAAYDAWMRVAAETQIPDGIDPDEIPDEQAQEMPDGSLRIFVSLPGRDVELIVAPGDWARRA